jgi:hypothetical protein
MPLTNEASRQGRALRTRQPHALPIAIGTTSGSDNASIAHATIHLVKLLVNGTFLFSNEPPWNV